MTKFKEIASLVCVLLLSQAGFASDKAWIHGSWVNLRAAPNASAQVRAQLVTNTEVAVLDRGEAWCIVKAPSGAEGYIFCSLLGAEPLSLQQATNNPARAFWIAPSVGRLIAYGSLLRTGPAYQRMYSKLQDGQIAQIPPLPEFDRAKRTMAASVTPLISAELDRGSPIEVGRMNYASLITPRPIKPSLFRRHGDVALASEGDADALAAVTSARIAVKVVAPPTGYVARHEGPEISGISGFGDIGEADLLFSPPMLMYFLLPNGLLSASHLSKQSGVGTPAVFPCGTHFTGTRSIDIPLGEFPSNALELKPAEGFPTIRKSVLAMAAFVTAQPLLKKKVMIRSRVARIPDFKVPQRSDGLQARPMDVAKVVLHEVDLDGDEVADILIWDMPSIGEMSGALNLKREWYLNIEGQWYSAGEMDEQECT